jgi:hypothetical protein
LIDFNHTNHGYATLTVDAKNISGVVTTIDERKYPGSPAADKFSYPVAPLILPKNAVISL